MVEETPAGWGVSFDVIAGFYQLMFRFRSRTNRRLGATRAGSTLPRDEGGIRRLWMGMKRGPVCLGRGDGGA